MCEHEQSSDIVSLKVLHRCPSSPAGHQQRLSPPGHQLHACSHIQATCSTASEALSLLHVCEGSEGSPALPPKGE
eukprot:1158367-Pelagomonas_calceolata.AAC.5